MYTQSNILKHEYEIGGGWHTRGFSLTTQYLNMQSEKMGWLGQIEFAEFKNLKEQRLSGDSPGRGGGGRSFVYGKRNNFYTLRLGGGQRIYISEKSPKSKVAVAFTYAGGFSMGMLKPYYLDLIYRSDNRGVFIRSEAYSERNQYKFLDPLDIDGASGFANGWDNLSIASGLYLKSGLVLDLGPNGKFSKIIEIGMSADLYFKQIDILIEQPNSPLFLNMYMNVYFGGRW